MDSNDNNIQNSVNNCDCHIEKLLKTRFCSLSYAEKEIIVKSQKPSPSLNISCKTKAFTRHFQKSIYNNIPWICGCAHLSKLFCWPCLLFSLEQNVWNKSGFDDLNNLSKARKRHEWSQYHIDARVKFKKFGNEKRKEFSFQKSEQHKINVEQHNKEVTANRYIISKLIDVVCFLSKQDFSFRGHFEGTDSDNRGNYTELLYFLSDADVLLKNYLENSKVFKDVSNAIQNDLINSILKVLLDEIRSEIKYAKFVSIIVDETTDVCDKAQLSTVFRYVDQNDILQERFVGFTDVSEDRKAYGFYDHIKKKINEFECKEKLIAYTYHGAAASEHRKIQKKIREINPSAIFVHCYDHRLNLVLSQSVSCISGCKFFFQTSLSFVSFFCNSSKRLSVLDYEIKKRFPTAVPTRWNDHGKILFMIHEYKTELGNVFDLMTEDHEEWDSDTVVKARGLQYYLKDFDFNFNLELFSSVLNYANILDEILQKQSFDINHCSKEVESFLKFLKSKRNEFDLMWDILENKEFKCLSRKRKHCDQFEDRKEIYKQRFYEIIDTLIKNTSDRFLDIGSLKLLALLDVNKFEEYRTLFPDLLLSSLRKNYSNHFDFLELKSELIYIYSSTDFSNLKTLQSLKDIIVENDLKDVIPEVYNLVNLVQTIPITSGSVECSFSKMKRIESKRRCSQIDERFSSLGLISIERNLLFALKTANKLYDKVIEEFCQKNHSIELIFK